MGFLTDEEKMYILEEGEYWDGKTKDEKCKLILEKNKSTIEDIIWLYENLDSFRKRMKREYNNKYHNERKNIRGPSFESGKLINTEQMTHLLELYIENCVDQAWWQSYFEWEEKPKGVGKECRSRKTIQ